MNYCPSIFATIFNQPGNSGNNPYFLGLNRCTPYFQQFYAANIWFNHHVRSAEEEAAADPSSARHRIGTESTCPRTVPGLTNHYQQLKQTMATRHSKEATLMYKAAYLTISYAVRNTGNRTQLMEY